MRLIWVKVLSKMIKRTSFWMTLSSMKIVRIVKEIFLSESWNFTSSYANPTTPWPNHPLERQRDHTYKQLLRKTLTRLKNQRYFHQLLSSLRKNTKSVNTAGLLSLSWWLKNTQINAILSQIRKQIRKI